MTEDPKQQRENQLIALSLVLIGLSAIALGCHFSWPELTTAAGGVSGGGLMMLTNNRPQTKTPTVE